MLLAERDQVTNITIFDDMLLDLDQYLFRFVQSSSKINTSLFLGADTFTYNKLTLFDIYVTSVKADEDLNNGIIYLQPGECLMEVYVDEERIYAEVFYVKKEPIFR